MNKLQVEPALEHLEPALLTTTDNNVSVVADKEDEPALGDVLGDDSTLDHVLELVILEDTGVEGPLSDDKVSHKRVCLTVYLSGDLRVAFKVWF